MSDFDDIQNLIRLKRHEQPSEDFVEDFVRSFQQRQRSEMLSQSARGLLWERVTTYFDGVFAPKWALAGATAVAMLGGFILIRPAAPVAGGFAQNGKTEELGGRLIPISDDEVRQYLLSRHYQGGFADERERPIAVHDSQMLVTPVGFKPDLEY